MGSDFAEFVRANAAPILLLLSLSCLAILLSLLFIQRRQLRALQQWEEERRAADQRRLDQERALQSAQQADRDARATREKQMQQSRQLMADAIATLQQLKRHAR
jgi:HAMP domain-containing protein